MSAVNDGNCCANFNNGIWYALSTRCDMITFSISIFLSQHTGLGNISIFHISFTAHWAEQYFNISFTAHFQYFNISIFQYLFHSTLGWASIRDVQSGLVKPDQVNICSKSCQDYLSFKFVLTFV